MAPSTASDKSLLDRLNALKQSSVSLKGPPSFETHAGASPVTTAAAMSTPSATAPAAGIDLADAATPVSREDALSARLKSLRQQHGAVAGQPLGPSSTVSPPVQSTPVLPSIPSPRDQTPSLDTVSTPTASVGKVAKVTKEIKPQRRSPIEGEESRGYSSHASSQDNAGGPNVHNIRDQASYDVIAALDLVDDQAVNDLLLDLAAEPLDQEDDYDVGDLEREAGTGDAFIELPSVPSSGYHLDAEDSEEDGEDNSQLVDDLFSSLGGVPKPSTGHSGQGQPKSSGGTHKKAEDDDDDDSDTGDMAKEVKAVLDQAQAEADLEKKEEAEKQSANEDEETEFKTSSEPKREDSEKRSGEKESADSQPTTKLVTHQSPPPTEAQPENLPEKKVAGEADQDKTDPDDPFQKLGLPSVPTKLVDPPPSPPKDAADEFAVRLAALRGISGKGGGGLAQVDAFGLPSVPTADPHDQEKEAEHRKWARKGDLSFGRVGYTDDDQSKWCTVCLEDAVFRCLGCDNDGYCARCWREMHVGPAAGFDERGHKRVPIERKDA